MTQDVWINLPVSNLARSIAFFTGHALADTSRGTVFAEPKESNGFMYGCGICDPDGHRWNVLFMDSNKM